LLADQLWRAAATRVGSQAVLTHGVLGLLPSIIPGAPVPSTARLADARDQFERRFIELALARASRRRARAARELGLSRQGLLRIMARLRMH
jgi:transcriptional regulator with GAF, ATPase, and Fis domain